MTADILLLLTSEKRRGNGKLSINDAIKTIISETILASKIKVDVSDLSQMLSVTRSILGSKSIIKVIYDKSGSFKDEYINYILYNIPTYICIMQEYNNFTGKRCRTVFNKSPRWISPNDSIV